MGNTAKNKSIVFTSILVLLLTVACVHLPDGTSNITATAQADDVSYAGSYYHYSLGTLFALSGDTDRAINEYKKTLNHDFTSSFLRIELARLYIKKRDFPKAVAVLEKSVEYNPDDFDTRVLLGGIYGNLKEFDKAIQEYRQAIRINPDTLEPYLFTSMFHREMKRYDEAIAALDELIARDPGNLMGHYSLAKTYEEMEQYDEAERAFKRVIEIKASHEPAILELGHLYEFRDKDEEALELYRDFLARYPSSNNTRFKLGKALFKLKRYSEAIDEFQAILDSGDTHIESYYSLGISLFFEGKDYNRAVEELTNVLRKQPDNHKARYFLASSYEKLDRRSDAYDEFGKIDEDSDLYSTARMQMGLILKDDGYLDEAIDLIRDAVEKKGDDEALYIFLISLYEEKGQLDQALDMATRAVFLLPKSIDLRYKLGIVYEKLDRYEESIAEMEKVLEFDPDYAEALNFIGYSYADREIRLDEAEAMIKRAMELKPDNGYITDSLGWLYFRKNQLDKAIMYLEKALQLAPEDPTIHEHLGDAYEKAGRTEEALELYRKALELDQGNDTLRKKINALSNPDAGE